LSPCHLVIFNQDARGFAATKAESVIAQADFDGIPERGHADEFDRFSLNQTHLHETLDKRIVTLEGRDPAALSRP
jgi:hypothetical protein